MEILKQLGSLVQQATGDQHQEPPLELYGKILTIVHTRVDMPKHVINAVSKRLVFKNKKILWQCFDLLEYLSFYCELSLYSQISTKEFLLKISTLLMNPDADRGVQTKILQTVKVWQQLFRPHDDLLPIFFQFYAQILKKEFPIQKDYVSPHKPKDFDQKRRKQQQQKRQEQVKTRSRKEKVVEPTKSQQQTFEQIRAKIILTNEIIDNANPADQVKANALLMEMMDEIKKSEKKINQTINQNPNEKIMELALAANDDIYIVSNDVTQTYRRFKDLQKNRKPEPFILTELASDYAKQTQIEQQKKIEKQIKSKIQPKPQQSNSAFDDWDQKPSPTKVEEKPKKPVDIFDVACEEPVKPKTEPLNLIDMAHDNPPPSQSNNSNLFDLLGGPSQNAPASDKGPTSPSMDFMNSYMGGSSTSGVNPPSNTFQTSYQGSPSFDFGGSSNPSNDISGQGNPQNFTTNFNGGGFQTGITLNQNNFATENDMTKYDDRSILDKLTDLASDLRENRKE